VEGAFLIAPILNLAGLIYLIWISVRVRAAMDRVVAEFHEEVLRIEDKTDAQTALLEQALTKKR